MIDCKMLKRLIFLISLILSCQGVVRAQGIEFMDNRPLDEVLSKAKSEGKMIFVDCYTSWCGPCKMLARDVFPQKEVGDFFNPRFVSLKLDMEKGEGPTLGKRWDVGVYPTLMFLTNDGEVLFQTVGSRNAVQLVDTVAYMLEHHRPSDVALRYKSDDRSAQVVSDYIAELKQQRKRNTIESVAGEFVSANREQLLSDTLAQRILIENVSNPYNEGFLFAYEHRGELPAGMTDAMEWAWKLYTKSFYVMGKKNDSLGLDEEGMNAYYEFMKKKGVALADDYYYSYKLPAAFLMKDKRMILECLDGCRNVQRVSQGQIDMAFRTLDELDLTDDERRQSENLKQYYSEKIINIK